MLVRLVIFKARSEAIKALVMIGIDNINDAFEILK